MMEFIDSSTMRYFKDDTIFHAINKQFVSLKKDDTKRINFHLHQVVDEILEKMKQDCFFKEVFQRKLFGGSYYKGTRIGTPTEFDIDIIIKLPINYELIRVEPSNHPGFVKIYSGLNQLTNNLNNGEINRSLKKLLDENMYFHQGKFRNWMEGILYKAITTLPRIGNKFILNINDNRYIITIKKSGPAFTFKIHFPDNETIDIDLVPVLEFSKSPPNIDNLYCCRKQNWFVVPKPLKNENDKSINGQTQILWRTCFYEQEKEILSRNGKIKHVIKLMKKFRDTQNWKNLASYYIETLALHEVQFNRNLETKSSTVLFMELLYKLHQSLKNKCITYYWCSEFNLLSKLCYQEIKNIENRLERIINKICNCIKDDKYIIASYILNCDELFILKIQDSENTETQTQPEETKNWCMIF